MALRNTFLFGLAGAVGVFVTSLFIPDRSLVKEGDVKPNGALDGASSDE